MILDCLDSFPGCLPLGFPLSAKAPGPGAVQQLPLKHYATDLTDSLRHQHCKLPLVLATPFRQDEPQCPPGCCGKKGSQTCGARRSLAWRDPVGPGNFPDPVS